MSLCLLLLLYHAWPTLRGRWILGFCYVNTCHAITSDLSVACFYLTHVYHLATVLSPDHLTCYYLARTLVMTWLVFDYYQSLAMTYPDYYQSLTMTCHQTIINLLPWLATRLLSISCHDLPLTKYQSLDMIGCLLNIIILSCYHLTPSMIYLTCDYHLYGNLDLLSCIIYSDLNSWIPDHVLLLLFP